MERLSLCISPCPNDTFAFDAIVNRRIGVRVAVQFPGGRRPVPPIITGAQCMNPISANLKGHLEIIRNRMLQIGVLLEISEPAIGVIGGKRDAVERI